MSLASVLDVTPHNFRSCVTGLSFCMGLPARIAHGGPQEQRCAFFLEDGGAGESLADL